MSVRRRYPSRTSSVMRMFWMVRLALRIDEIIFPDVTTPDLLKYHTQYRRNTFCSDSWGWRLCARLNLNARSMLRNSIGSCFILINNLWGLTLSYIHRRTFRLRPCDVGSPVWNSFPILFCLQCFPTFMGEMYGISVVHLCVCNMHAWIWSMHNNCVPIGNPKSNSNFDPHPLRKIRFAIRSHSSNYIINPTTVTTQTTFCASEKFLVFWHIQGC
jgi:hypothetical protein